MPRVNTPGEEDIGTSSPNSEAAIEVSPSQRPLPPNPGVGGSYLLDETEWVWVLQPTE